MNIEEYKGRNDVPWYYRPYIRMSGTYLEQLRHDIIDRVAKWEEKLSDEDCNVELVTELRDCALRDIDNIEEIRSMFVPNELCNEEGFTIDLPQYHTDQAERNEREVEKLKALLASPECDTEENMRLVTEEIKKLTRFAKANRRKAKTGFPNEKEILRLKLRNKDESEHKR